MEIDTLRTDLGDLESEHDVIDRRLSRIEEALIQLALGWQSPASAGAQAYETIRRPL